MLLTTINRGIVLITPKQPYYDWSNSLSPDFQMGPEHLIEPSAFLVSDEEEYHQDVYELIVPHLNELFEEMLFGISMDQECWPKDRTLELFKEWFDITYSSMVSDLVDHEVLEHDDPFEDIAWDELEEDIELEMMDDLEERALIIDIQKHKDRGGGLPEA